MKPIIEEIYNTVLSENADSELNSIITRLCDGSGNINIMLPSLQAFFVATCSLRIKAPIVVRLNVEREHYRLVVKDLLAFMGENVFLFPDYKKETAAVSVLFQSPNKPLTALIEPSHFLRLGFI